MSLSNLLEKSVLPFVDRYKISFILIALLLANAYQYGDRGRVEQRYFEENKKLHEKNLELVQNTLNYERNRSERLEFLLNSLTKHNEGK